jgi:hypothetical protein
LAQLRTRASRLNSYLFKIRMAETAAYGCGVTVESTKHFLFTCSRWVAERRETIKKWAQNCGDKSFFLRGKTPADVEGWRPCKAAVDAAVVFAKATMRLGVEVTAA